MPSLRRTALAIGVLVALFAAAFNACGSESSPAAATAGAGGGGAGAGTAGGGAGGANVGGSQSGASAMGGAPDGGAAGGGAGGGSSGAAGSGGGAGPMPIMGVGPGQAPIWKKFAGLPSQCNFDVLVNPAEASPAFDWSVCPSGAASCLQMAVRPAFATPASVFSPNASGYSDGSNTWLAFDMYDVAASTTMFLLTHPDGTIAFGLRGHQIVECFSAIPAFGEGHIGLNFQGKTTDPAVSQTFGLLASLADLKFAVSPVTTFPNGPGPNTAAISQGRLAWRWGAGLKVSTFLDTDGSAPATVCTLATAGAECGDPTAVPGGFVFDLITTPDPAFPWRLFFSDGVAPATSLLTDPASDNSTPRFTGSHVVWQRGIGQLPNMRWTTMEVWMAPFANGVLGEPMRLWTIPGHDYSLDARGGAGRFAMPSTWNDGDQRTLHVWEVPSGMHRAATIAKSPNALGNVFLVGDDVYVNAHNQSKNTTPSIFRVNVAAMAAVP